MSLLKSLRSLKTGLTKLWVRQTRHAENDREPSSSPTPSWGEGTFAELSQSDVDKLLNKQP
jgi:hypothetical protein